MIIVLLIRESQTHFQKRTHLELLGTYQIELCKAVQVDDITQAGVVLEAECPHAGIGESDAECGVVESPLEPIVVLGQGGQSNLGIKDSIVMGIYQVRVDVMSVQYVTITTIGTDAEVFTVYALCRCCADTCEQAEGEYG